MLIYSCFISFLLTVIPTLNKPVPSEIHPFIKNGHAVLDYKIGDLNNDQLSDVILILKDTNEESRSVGFPRSVIILTRNSKGNLKKTKENNKIIFQTDEGGVF